MNSAARLGAIRDTGGGDIPHRAVAARRAAVRLLGPVPYTTGGIPSSTM